MKVIYHPTFLGKCDSQSASELSVLCVQEQIFLIHLVFFGFLISVGWMFWCDLACIGWPAYFPLHLWKIIAIRIIYKILHTDIVELGIRLVNPFAQMIAFIEGELQITLVCSCCTVPSRHSFSVQQTKC